MKIPFVDFELYSKALKIPSSQDTTNDTNSENLSVIQTNSRSSTVVDAFVGKIISVYNGRRSKRILIKPEMIGYKLGSFIFTKKLGKSIHNSEHNRKKKEKMRRKITQKKIRKTTTKGKKTKAPTKAKKKK